MEYEPEEKLTVPRRRFMAFEVPLWLFIVSLVVIAAISYPLFIYFRTTTYSYLINVPGATASSNQFVYGASPALANADYFAKVKNTFIAEKVNFVEADLSAMKLTVYKDGRTIKEVSIKTKGREGSWWETPAGLYKIEFKETNHFSSIGKVYQPWSMAFQGNFFIHGRPYYKDGTEVSSAYSGGCIRLDSDDAKEVYDLVSTGMPVLVYEKDFTADAFNYRAKQPAAAAKSFLAADLKNDFVFAEKNLNSKMPIASITKLMTSLVAAEYINLDKSITITKSMLATTSKPRLKVGQEITTYNLLFPLLEESSNEAAEALALQLGRERFIMLMNQKAGSLGLQSTHFADPSGVEADNVSTPGDLFSILKYIYNNRSFVFKISSGNVSVSSYGEPVYRNLANFNIVPGVYDKFVGGKIGKSTPAEETYVGVFEVVLQGETRPIAVVVLGSANVYDDVAAIMRYVHENYD